MNIRFKMEASAMPLDASPEDYVDCDSAEMLEDKLIESIEEQACISTSIAPEDLEEFWQLVEAVRDEAEKS